MSMLDAGTGSPSNGFVWTFVAQDERDELVFPAIAAVTHRSARGSGTASTTWAPSGDYSRTGVPVDNNNSGVALRDVGLGPGTTFSLSATCMPARTSPAPTTSSPRASRAGSTRRVRY